MRPLIRPNGEPWPTRRQWAAETDHDPRPVTLNYADRSLLRTALHTLSTGDYYLAEDEMATLSKLLRRLQ